MISLKSQIEEALYSKSGNNSKNMLFNLLKKYSYDTLEAFDKKMSPWNEASGGSITQGRNGIEIDCGPSARSIYPDCIMTIEGIETAECPQFNISKVVGDIVISNCKVKNLKGLFADDCEIDGQLSIHECDRLTSLEGLPKKVTSFDCTENKSLKDIKGAPMYDDNGGTFVFQENGKLYGEKDIKEYLKNEYKLKKLNGYGISGDRVPKKKR